MLQSWHLIQVSASSERKAVTALREQGFTVVRPVETRWKPTSKGVREKAEYPLFVGYLFAGVPIGRFDKIHDVRVPIKVVPTSWDQGRFFSMVADFAFRQMAGEFDRTGEVGRPKRPIVGPLMRTLGNGMSCLEALLTTDDKGRVQLLESGALIEDGEPVETQDLAA